MNLPRYFVRVAPCVCAVLLLAACVAAARETEPVYPPTAQVKAAFLRQLEREKVPLDATTRSSQTDADADGRGVENVSIASERKADGTIERVPLLIVRPAN